MYRSGWKAVAPFVDYYQILGVHRQAEPEVIDAAFRAMARRFHPDRNVGDRSASERTRQVIEAHAVLSDPEKRRAYNRDWDAQHLPPPPVAKEPPSPRPTTPQPKPPPSAHPFAARPPSQPAAAKDRPQQRSSNWWRGVTFLALALISTSIAITLVIAGSDQPRGPRGDSAFIVLICLAGGFYFGRGAWSIFQVERSLVGLTEENISQALTWGRKTACPPAGRGCYEIPRSIGEARQTCTWSGLCRIGGIMLRDGRGSQSWEVWIDGRTGLGQLRQRGRRTR
jgi:DnaJ domain